MKWLLKPQFLKTFSETRHFHARTVQRSCFYRASTGKKHGLRPPQFPEKYVEPRVQSEVRLKTADLVQLRVL
jgi:hypothetical protein